MPTVILLDVSLSMCRLASRQTPMGDAGPAQNRDAVEVRQLANVGIGTLLDYLAQNSPLEHTAFVVFSSLWEIRNQFTRSHETIKSGIYELELYDKSNIVNALRGVATMKLDEWSQNGSVNIILVTDGQYSARRFANPKGDDFNDIPLEELDGHFDFPCKLQVVCLCSPRDPILKHNMRFFKKLVATVDSSSKDFPVVVGRSLKPTSAIWLPESSTLDVTVEAVESLFSNMAELHYKPYHSVLSFGRLSSMVLLSPKPTDCLVEPLQNEFDALKDDSMTESDNPRETFVTARNKKRLFSLNEEINICGFMASIEIASPAVISRHLLVPIADSKFNETHKAQQILSQDPNAYFKSLQTCPMSESLIGDKASGSSRKTPTDSTKTNARLSLAANDELVDQDITKQPSFCVLLHNCLKQENLVAICIVGRNNDPSEDWYGILYPHVDARKRSNLMLSLLLPGSSPILWLPNFKSLGSVSLNQDSSSAISEKSRGPSKSYSSNNVIWLDPESVQADVQRIVRHVKRGLDKAPHFYKELNRIRRAAISYGFYDVLSGLASILEREKRVLLPDVSRPGYQQIIEHIDHVIASLRLDLNEESYDTRLIPPV